MFGDDPFALETPNWGPNYFFCSWGCIALFTSTKHQEQISEMIYKPFKI